jgi:hypothetical protein
MKLDVKTASVDTLDAVKGKTGRVCPLICEFGYKADSDRCVRITCGKGSELNDDGVCERIEVRKPTAKREEPRRQPSERAKLDGAPAKPQVSGQIMCNNQGCRPVQKGCRVEGGGGQGMGQREVCN